MTNKLANDETKDDFSLDFKDSGSNKSPSQFQRLPIAVPADVDAVASGFQGIMHDAEPQFRSVMQTTFGNTFGLEIIALRIEKIEFADKKMQQQVSQSAIGYTTLAAQEATINQQMKLKRAEADRDAAKIMIDANAEANKNLITMEAQTKAAIIQAEGKARIAKINAEADANAEVAKLKTLAENSVYVAAKNAESLQIKSTAEANSRLLLAESEAKSKRLIGEVEVEILRQKNELPLSTVEILARAQVNTFKNTEKQIIYSNEAPFAMHQMNQMFNNCALAAVK